MKTIFKLNESKTLITAYELGDIKQAEYAVSRFIDDHYGLTGFKDAGTHTSSYDEGYEKLVWGENGELLLQRRTGKKYLGLMQQSNIGVAGHGCDHYYEDAYSYSYIRSSLPKDISAAFTCMYSTIYYNGFIDKVINAPLGRYPKINILEEEKAILAIAKRNLEIATAQVTYDEFNKKNNDMVWYILGTIFIKETKEYPITCVEDLIQVFEKYYHPIKYCMSLYGKYGHKFNNINEFLNSLYTKGDSFQDEEYKRKIKEVFSTFDLTPEWLDYTKSVQEERGKKLRMRRY